jgi:pentatricopeptide repeat protein
MPKQNMVSWTIMIATYVQQEKSKKALNLFCEMQQTGTKIDKHMLGNMLRACSSLVAQEQGEQIHAHIITTVHLFPCGRIDVAQQEFDKLHERNMVSWTTVIKGYVQYEHSEETLKFFRQVQVEGMEPDFLFSLSLLKYDC